MLRYFQYEREGLGRIMEWKILSKVYCKPIWKSDNETQHTTKIIIKFLKSKSEMNIKNCSLEIFNHFDYKFQ
jgi:hypothetical protein